MLIQQEKQSTVESGLDGHIAAEEYVAQLVSDVYNNNNNNNNVHCLAIEEVELIQSRNEQLVVARKVEVGPQVKVAKRIRLRSPSVVRFQ